MPTSMDPNGPGKKIMLDVTVEDDDGVFLSVNAQDAEEFDPVFDYVTTDAQEIDQFFEDVEAAKKKWEAMRA